MSKDTIYIDVEDDITAIIGKVKSSKSKIVALVPPKRIGVLQSAVNLRLLARAAKQGNKHLVLISGNSALTALAASANISSARNLQSKPELAVLPSTDDDAEDDIIDGVDLPVGDHTRTTEKDDDKAAALAASPAIDSAIRANSVEESAPARAYARPNTAKRNAIRVPNFDTFRKKLAVSVVGLIALVGFLVWAVWFAPNATIAITARTIESSVNPSVTIAVAASTDASAGTLRAVRQEIKREASVAFEATGSKEVGEKSSGQVVFQNCESRNTITIAAGTGISAGGKTYITQAAASVPGGSGSSFRCTTPGRSSPVEVVAQDIGDDYDVDRGTQFNVAGRPNSDPVEYFRAVASTDIDGGSKRRVTVVTADDVSRATEQLRSENTDGMRQQLEERFSDSTIALDASFSVGEEAVISTPAVDIESSDGNARLSGTLVFAMLGVEKAELEQFLDAYLASELEDEEDQRVYNNGVDKVSFMSAESGEGGTYTATMTATATFGPKIDDQNVKSEARGKRYGEVQTAIERIPGIQDVDVRFSPFWVRTVPQDENRITIEFNLDESESE